MAPGGSLTLIDRITGPRWQVEGSDWIFGSRGFGWKLFLPEAGNEAMCAYSDAQEAAEVIVNSAGDGVRWSWAGIRSESGRHHDITVRMTLVTDGSALSCQLELDNHDDGIVASALFPSISGLSVREGQELRVLTRDYYGARWWSLWPTFDWNKAYYGTLRPTLMTDSLVFGNPTAPFTVVSDGAESVAATVAGPTAAISAWQWELDPGYADTVGSSVAADALLCFHAVHLTDLRPGGRVTLPTIELTHASGGWESALSRYRGQRGRLRRAQPAPPVPGWAATPTSWYQVGLNTAAGDRNLEFADLPGLARECASAGVEVMHVIGWNTGGQDRNNPSHEPDPDLGGAAGLLAAIEECHDLGVKVVLFAKFTWADQATVRFREVLAASAVRNPYGDYYLHGGYQYLVPHQLMDVSTRRLVPMCYLHEDYLRVCEAEFDRILATGADGVLIDEAMHHTPALLCYADGHGHAPGASVYAGDATLARRLRARVPADREFLFAGESLYEDLQSSYHVSYIRSHYVDHVPITRYVNPRLQMLTTVSGFDDRNQLNQALLYGYLFCYEPRHFKGRLSDMPKTVAYGAQLQRLRTDLATHLWRGSYLGAAPLALMPDVPHATARWRGEDGTELLALANYDATEHGHFTFATPVREVRTPDTAWSASGPGVTVAPRSVVVAR